MDEPTEGIQPSLVDEVQSVVASFKGSLSVLLIEQFLDFAMAVADQCYVMESGRIVMQGAPGQVDLELMRQYLAV
jgi:urea transport system ATP-binding protein